MEKIKHNGGFKYEIYAQSILSSLFPNKYGNLQLSDRPDLIDPVLQLGVEVVHPCVTSEEEAIRVFDKYFAERETETLDQERLSRLRKSGYDVISWNGKQVQALQFPQAYTLQVLKPNISAVQNKLQKLNAHLYQYEHNLSLYLATMQYGFEYDYDEIARYILFYCRQMSQEYEIRFQKVFYDVCHYLYLCSIDGNTIDRYNIQDIHARARIFED